MKNWESKHTHTHTHCNFKQTSENIWIWL